MIKRLMIVIIGLFLVATPAFALDVSNMNTFTSRYYAMEDTSGNIVDSTGNQNGVATGISYGETGIIDDAIGFDGTSGDKVVVNGYPTSSTGVFSACTWVYVTGSKAWENVWRADQTGVYRNVALQRTGDPAGTYSDSWRYVFSTGFDAVGGTVNYNQWDHICTTNDGSTAKLYQNGALVDSDSISSVSVTWNYDLTLGIRPDTGSEKFTGNMDEIAMFDGYALNITEVEFLYALGSPDSRQQYTFTTAAPNTAPTITPIVDQQTNEDEPIPIVPSAFTIGDAEDAIGSLTLSYTSSDTALINSTGSITFDVNTSTGVVDMLDITPNANAFGTSIINVTVTDTGALTNSTQFLLTVFAVNDAPTITPIADQTTTEGATLVINFNVTDVDNPYTDLTYSAVAGNTNLIDSAVFSNYDGTNQTLTLVAGDYGITDINVSVQDLQPAIASTQFQYLVNCNTTANYYTPMNVSIQTTTGTTEPVACLSQTFNFDIGSDILTYEWYDFGGTMTDIELYVYDATGNNRILINQTTLSTNNGTQTFDYSSSYQNNDLLVIAELTDGTRNFGGTTPNQARILESNVNQQGQLGTLFSDADGIIYGVLILLLFLTIGIASQSATLTLIFSVLGLFIASRFVLKIPSEFIWITGALVVILLYLIAKLRTD